MYNNQKIKNHSVLAKIYKVYIICTPKCYAFGNSFFPLLNIIECYKAKQTTNVLFPLPSIVQYAHRSRLVL